MEADMADEVSVEGDGSKFNVAFKLLMLIMRAELGSGSPPDRKWVLQAYSECIRTVVNGKPPGA